MTIPVDVRSRLGLRPGSRLAFVASVTGGYEIHPVAASIKDLNGPCHGHRTRLVPRRGRPGHRLRSGLRVDDDGGVVWVTA